MTQHDSAESCLATSSPDSCEDELGPSLRFMVERELGEADKDGGDERRDLSASKHFRRCLLNVILLYQGGKNAAKGRRNS
jgi:hypothetical protein